MLIRILADNKAGKKMDTFGGEINQKYYNYIIRICMGPRKGLWVKQRELNRKHAQSVINSGIGF